MKGQSKLIILSGPSGSGKTTVALELARRTGLKVINSYTTRKQRAKNDEGHEFVSMNEFDKLNCFISCIYDGEKYGVTKKQLEDGDIYVIDPPSFIKFKKIYKDKRIIPIYLQISSELSEKRFRIRGGTEKETEKRKNNDKNFFGEKFFAEYDLVIDSKEKTIDKICDEILEYINKESR